MRAASRVFWSGLAAAAAGLLCRLLLDLRFQCFDHIVVIQRVFGARHVFIQVFCRRFKILHETACAVAQEGRCKDGAHQRVATLFDGGTGLLGRFELIFERVANDACVAAECFRSRYFHVEAVERVEFAFDLDGFFGAIEDIKEAFGADGHPVKSLFRGFFLFDLKIAVGVASRVPERRIGTIEIRLLQQYLKVGGAIDRAFYGVTTLAVAGMENGQDRQGEKKQ